MVVKGAEMWGLILILGLVIERLVFGFVLSILVRVGLREIEGRK